MAFSKCWIASLKSCGVHLFQWNRPRMYSWYAVPLTVARRCSLLLTFPLTRMRSASRIPAAISSGTAETSESACWYLWPQSCDSVSASISST